MLLRIATLLLPFSLTLQAGNFNAVILQQIQEMPSGGGYATTKQAHHALASSINIKDNVRISPENACPSYCSGATYLVFLKTLGELQKMGNLQLTRSQWQTLMPNQMADGHGIWGRWNANGPGTARLFHELQLGKNFTSYSEAKAGDFMKIFWTDAVGKNERGHSVIYLGSDIKNGVESVRFWSSNKPHGYGEKSVPKSKIAGVIFSRLENPQNLAHITMLPKKDDYLANLLKKDSSFVEALRMVDGK